MLDVWSSWQGAHGVRRNRSPEFAMASGGPVRGRGQCCGPREDKRRTWLAAQGHGKDACVIEKMRGGQCLPGIVVGEKTGGGAVRASPSQSSGVPAV